MRLQRGATALVLAIAAALVLALAGCGGDEGDAIADAVETGEVAGAVADAEEQAGAVDLDALAAEACSGAPAAELQGALGWTQAEVRRVAEELTRSLDVEDRDGLIEACIAVLER